jgi:hypothetical protein
MKKIMFSDAFCLTQAVLDGTKTMTRRVLRDNVPLGNWEETKKHLPYKVGDIVAIAQPYKDIIECLPKYSDIIINVDGSINREYKAGWTNKKCLSVLICSLIISELQMLRWNTCRIFQTMKFCERAFGKWASCST